MTYSMVYISLSIILISRLGPIVRPNSRCLTIIKSKKGLNMEFRSLGPTIGKIVIGQRFCWIGFTINKRLCPFQAFLSIFFDGSNRFWPFSY